MRVFIQLLFAGLTAATVGWYVIYKTNPAKICKEHPQKERAATHVYCWPGSDMPLDSFVDGHSPINRKTNKFKYTK